MIVAIRRFLRPGCLGWAAAFGGAILFALWAWAPDLVRWAIEYAGARAGFSIRIESARLDLFGGAIELRGIRGEARDPIILSRFRADDLRVRYSLRRLIAEGIDGIESVRVERARVDLDPESVPPSEAPAAEPTRLPAIAFPPIEIIDGELSVRTGGRTLRFAGIDVSLAGGAGRARLAALRVDGGLSPEREAWLARRLPVWIAIDRIDLVGVAASRIELGAGETLRNVRLTWGDGPLRGSFGAGLIGGEAEVEAELDGRALSFALRARGLRPAAIAEAAPDLLPDSMDSLPSAIVSIEARMHGPVVDPLLWQGEGTFAVEGAEWRSWRVDRVQAAFEATEDGLTIRDAEAIEGTNHATFAATLSRDGDLRGRVAFSAASLAASPLARFIEDADGAATGRIRFEGPIDDPSSWLGEADVALDSAQWRTWRVDRAHAEVTLIEEGLVVFAAELTEGDSSVEIDGFVSRERAVSARATFRIGTIASSPVARILEDAGGDASGYVIVTGSIDDPKTWRGKGEIGIDSPRWGTVSLDRIRAAFALTDAGIEIVKAEARDGASRSSLAGTLSRQGRIRAQWEFSVPSIAECDLARRIAGPEGGDGAVSGSLHVEGFPARIETLRIEGRLAAERVRVRGESIDRFDATCALAGGGLAAGASFSGPNAQGRISVAATLEPPATEAPAGAARILAGFRSPLPDEVPRVADARITTLDLDLAGEAICLLDPIRVDAAGMLDPFRILVAGQTIHVEGRQGLADPDSLWVDLSIRSEAVDLSLLEGTGLPFRRARGTAIARAQVTGPVAEPWIEAEVELRDGEIAFEGLATPLRALEGRVRLEGERLRLEGVRGRYGGGTIELAGGATLSGPPPGSAEASAIDLDLQFKGRNLLLTRSTDMLVRAHADLRWKGSLDASEVSGAVRVTRGIWSQEWRPTFRSRPIPRELFRLEDPILGPARLDITFEPARNLHLKNRLIDMRPDGRIFLRGTGAEPALSGTIEATAGTVTFAKAKLTIRSAVIAVREGASFGPTFDVRLDGEVGEYKVTIVVTGTLDSPRVEISSDPPLPKEQILALMATGKPSPGGKEGAEAAALGLASYFGPDLLEELFGIRAGGGGPLFLSRFSFESESRREGDDFQSSYRLRFDVSKRFAVQAERGYFGDYNFDLLYRFWIR